MTLCAKILLYSQQLEAVYSEIFRVLKPGGTFVTYEWLVTDKFDATNPNHIKIIDDIVYGNSLPVWFTIRMHSYRAELDFLASFIVVSYPTSRDCCHWIIFSHFHSLLTYDCC